MNPEDIGKMADVVPEDSRNALFEAPLRSIGYAINGYLHYKFGPLIKMGAINDAATKSLAESIEEKTKDLKEEDVDRKKLGLSIKAIDEAGYQLDNETLRNMFANLITKSINKHQNLDSSPLMVSVLTSLSPEAAEFLNSWHNQFPQNVSTFSQIELEQMKNGTSNESSLLVQNIIILSDLKVYQNEYVIDELRQLGIFDLAKDNKLTHSMWEEQYAVVEKIASTQFSNLQTADQKIVAKYGSLSLSPFGRAFVRILLD
ncbi:Abi-alpha family protein [Leuconostoc gasicomitatum]|uniref:Abi-alpha family protein n=1 Tax=Leuconostoc gasicomitatum TaxID=115778 RepID=UPI001CC41D3E|nr:Abi-alpha family protein [Leuconostoc gasicomitatum]MBZ5961473.1 DUF4393 domain-containing protein [Leuconostoc gasicomitatum]MBZ5970553.1 DUF4393 domain-containing protein [Leuconostoc gasicomitatum]MBZ5993827.1 DUF4393 domain-containing protein [Leuconostoc gasicomitatum]MBZ5997195.1 DUF4393 domain-containing protein [Leuconostoc gasicomitatum]